MIEYSKPHNIRLRDILPDKHGKYVMREYDVYTYVKVGGDDYRADGCYGGVLVNGTRYWAHHQEWCTKNGIIFISSYIRNKQLREVIKTYITTGGFAGMNLNQYVDAMLGWKFRRTYKLSTLVRRGYQGRPKHINLNGL